MLNNNLGWAVSSNQVERILTRSSIRASTPEGSCERTCRCTTTVDSCEYHQHRIRTHEGERGDIHICKQHKQQLQGYHVHHIRPNLAIQVSLAESITTPHNEITSEITHFMHIAHQPIPLWQQSAYSELSVNLKFMERLEREEQVAATYKHQLSLPTNSKLPTSALPPTIAIMPSQAATPLPSSNSNRNHVRQLLPSTLRNERSKSVKVSATMTDKGVHIFADTTSSPNLWIPTKLTFVDESTAQTPPPPADKLPSTSSGMPMRNTKEPKKPSLACTFCRERKIACGRPPQGSPNPTCNQCARRSFTTCKYVDSHPRNKRRSQK